MTLQAYDPFEEVLTRPVVERGAWLATATGGMWSIHHPSPADVSIRDIAAGLSRACRYNGQIVEECDFLSVSEHSVCMTDWAIANGAAKTREAALAVLLHDGSEAFFGDMVTPLKQLLPGFREIEDRAQSVILQSFGLNAKNTGISKSDIKMIDNRIRIDERNLAIMDPARTEGKKLLWDKDPDLQPLNVRLKGLNPREARVQFLEMFVHCIENLPASDPGITGVLAPHVQDAHAYLNEINAKIENSYSEGLNM